VKQHSRPPRKHISTEPAQSAAQKMMKKLTFQKGYSEEQENRKVSSPSNVLIVERLVTLPQNAHTRTQTTIMLKMLKVVEERTGKQTKGSSLRRKRTYTQKNKMSPPQMKTKIKETMKNSSSWDLNNTTNKGRKKNLKNK